MLGVILIGLMCLPCLIPLLRNITQNMVESIVQSVQKTNDDKKLLIMQQITEGTEIMKYDKEKEIRENIQKIIFKEKGWICGK